MVTPSNGIVFVLHLFCKVCDFVTCDVLLTSCLLSAKLQNKLGGTKKIVIVFMNFSKLGILNVRRHQLFPFPFKWLTCGDWPLCHLKYYIHTHSLIICRTNEVQILFCCFWRLLSILVSHPFLLACALQRMEGSQCMGFISGVWGHTPHFRAMAITELISQIQLVINLRH